MSEPETTQEQSPSSSRPPLLRRWWVACLLADGFVWIAAVGALVVILLTWQGKSPGTRMPGKDVPVKTEAENRAIARDGQPIVAAIYQFKEDTGSGRSPSLI
jgi:hypothetical protein